MNLDVPDRYASHFNNIAGAFNAAYIVETLLRSKQGGKVLVVGVFGGRDYWYLKNKGYEVFGLDIGIVPDIDKLTIADVQKELPFEVEFFDAVVMCEVLEHITEDYQALLSVHTILKRNGIMVVAVPYLADSNPCHIRVHTPKTIVRLLEETGYEIDEVVERPGLFRMGSKSFQFVNHGINLLTYAVLGRTVYNKYLQSLAKMEFYFGKKYATSRFFSWIRKRSKHWGVYIKAKKCVNDPKQSILKRNKSKYTAECSLSD